MDTERDTAASVVLPDASLATESRRWLTPVIAVVALILAGGSFYQSLQQRRLAQTYETSLHNLVSQQDALSRTVSEEARTRDQQRQEWQSRLNDLTSSMQRMLKQRLYQKQDWILLKTRHYLELAQINTHWSDDAAASIALLQQADTLLQELPDQRVFPIRQRIAEEISQLRAWPVVDVAGLLSQLDAAQTAVDTLPVKALTMSPTPQTPSSDPTATTWRKTLQDSVTVLEKLVVIRHNNDLAPVLLPMQQALLRERIRMNLQTAQWAILQNNSVVYQSVLAQSLRDIQQAFDTEASGTQALIQSLQHLQKQTLSPAKPGIDQSLRQLNQLIETAEPGEVKP